MGKVFLLFFRQAFCSGSLVSWGFFSPNGAALDYIQSLCQSGKVRSMAELYNTFYLSKCIFIFFCKTMEI